MTVNRRAALQIGGGLAGGIIASQSGLARAIAADGTTSTLVLNGVTIVDTRDGSLQPNVSVTIAGGKITAIGAGAPTNTGALTVDAHGMFLVPGYNDLHAHPLSSIDTEGSLSMMLANGITGFREDGRVGCDARHTPA